MLQKCKTNKRPYIKNLLGFITDNKDKALTLVSVRSVRKSWECPHAC